MKLDPAKIKVLPIRERLLCPDKGRLALADK